MGNSDQDAARAASGLYRSLAEALAVLGPGDPPPWMVAPGQDWPLFVCASELILKGLFAAANLPVQAHRQMHSSLQTSDALDLTAQKAVERLGSLPAETIAERRKRAKLLTGGPGRPRFCLYESMYLNGNLLGHQTLAVERWYRRFGLEPAGAELPDHASTELAFLSFLVENRDRFPGKERQFIRQHAGRWLPALGRSLASANDPVYSPIGVLLSSWIEARLRGKKRRTVLSRAEPTLPDSKNCTLCGFCAQACPVRAITLWEDARQTWLAFDPQRCTGCGQCARSCAFGVMHMGPTWTSRPASTGETIILKKSNRATCCSCGKPTVSLDELRYLAGILGNPSWLNQCAGCRASTHSLKG